MSIDQLIQQHIQQEVAPLKRQVGYLLAMLPNSVDTETAMRITGKTRETLQNERKRKGTVLKFHHKGDRPMYDLFSLIAYCEKSGETPESIQQRLLKIQQ